jgi:hypothetical protein
VFSSTLINIGTGVVETSTSGSDPVSRLCPDVQMYSNSNFYLSQEMRVSKSEDILLLTLSQHIASDDQIDYDLSYAKSNR